MRINERNYITWAALRKNGDTVFLKPNKNSLNRLSVSLYANLWHTQWSCSSCQTPAATAGIECEKASRMLQEFWRQLLFCSLKAHSTPGFCPSKTLYQFFPMSRLIPDQMFSQKSNPALIWFSSVSGTALFCRKMILRFLIKGLTQKEVCQNFSWLFATIDITGLTSYNVYITVSSDVYKRCFPADTEQEAFQEDASFRAMRLDYFIWSELLNK